MLVTSWWYCIHKTFKLSMLGEMGSLCFPVKKNLNVELAATEDNT